MKTSIFSYLMGMMASITALSTRQYMLGMLILAYCQIQLAEAMIWRGIDTSQPSLNRLGTLYAKYTLPLHLLFVGLGVVMGTDTKYKYTKYIPLLIGILFYAGVVWFYYDDSSIKDWVKPSERDVSFSANRACMKRECQNNENRLQWPFDDQWYILQTFLMYLVFFIYFPSKQFIILFTFFTTTFVISKMMYIWSTSSIWCFLSAILAPVLVYANSVVL